LCGFDAGLACLAGGVFLCELLWAKAGRIAQSCGRRQNCAKEKTAFYFHFHFLVLNF